MYRDFIFLRNRNETIDLFIIYIYSNDFQLKYLPQPKQIKWITN